MPPMVSAATKKKFPLATTENMYHPKFPRKRPRNWTTTYECDDLSRTLPKSCAVPVSPESNYNKQQRQRFGLMDLFEKNSWNNTSEKSKGTKSFHLESPHNSSSEPFTLRIEHMSGGAVAKHAGEERFLLFRSDRAGAIAKIVFSSSAPLVVERTGDSFTTNIESTAANATIHVLFVKDMYRGFQLGGFLFALCTSYLKEQYRNSICSSILCRLDAEEDIRRHGKLIQFYEEMGCTKQYLSKPVTYLHNNDGESYRKVPMKLNLRVAASPTKLDCSNSIRKNHHISETYASFLPAQILSESEDFAVVENQAIESWLIVECPDGTIQFRTTDSRMLLVDDFGNCKLVDTQYKHGMASSSLGSFELLKAFDTLDPLMHHKEEKEHCVHGDLLLEDCHGHSDSTINEGKLWVLRKSATLDEAPTYLSMACDGTLTISQTASFWKTDEDFGLVHTLDSPARRLHYQRLWKTQCVAYTNEMREKYSNFDIHSMTIQNALDLVKELPANPFSVSNNTIPSMRSLLFHTAELTRSEGHPDWLQLVALIHGLAGALKCLGMTNTGCNLCEEEINDSEGLDWTLYSDARVLGCNTQHDSTFAEYRHCNPDRNDTRYSTTNGDYHEGIGLEHVTLSWTSNEYMYSMLRHNHVRLPEEAYAILKLFPLVDWHTRGKHGYLENDNDKDVKPFVAEFYELFQRSNTEMIRCEIDHNSSNMELGDEECNDLWRNHYAHIAEKYGAYKILDW